MTTSRRTNKIDVSVVREAAGGRWSSILTAVGGISAECLDGRHQPCPKCGGQDRFRAFEDFEQTGGLFCNQCFSSKNGDGFAAVAWLLSIPFPAAVDRVAEYLGLTTKKATDPAKDLVFEDWTPAFAAIFCQAKPGLTEEGLLLSGARMARYQKRFTVIAWPIIGADLDCTKPVGYVVANYNGAPLPKFNREGTLVSSSKVKITFGSKPGLVGQRAVEGISKPGDAELVWKVEGVSDLVALQSLIPEHLRDRHLVITNANGAKETPKWRATTLAQLNCNVLHDADQPGDIGAKKWATSIASQAAAGVAVKHVELPYEVAEHHGKDLRDWINEGHSYADLIALAESTAPQTTTQPLGQGGDDSESTNLPEVILPGGEQTISDTGSTLGKLFAVKRTHFIRGESIVRLVGHEDADPRLTQVCSAGFASDCEQVASLVKVVQGPEGPEMKATICSETAARGIMKSQAFISELPPLRVLSRCPVLVERDGQLVEVAGYDRPSGIYASGQSPETLDLNDAKRLLHDALSGFRFATQADRSRAMAALITPALVAGGLLRGRAPIDLGEADQSQTGKGFRNKVTAAIYNHVPVAISQQRAGVGSMEESFDRALIAGKTFIALDNVRGKVDSQKIESFLTEDTYYARAAYQPNTEIDPCRVYVMFTSNKADMTTDLANRSSCVRILKQPDGFQYPTYPEGDVLQHIRARQPLYLGAIFAIVRAWHAAGKPRTNETRHDFRAWAQPMDWIVQNLLGCAQLMDGHRETQRRMTTPAMSWLREVALAVVRQGKEGEMLTAASLVEVADADGIEIPGLKGDMCLDEATRKVAFQQTGKRLGQCFGDIDRIEIDHLIVDREFTFDSDGHQRRLYRICLKPADSLPANAPSLSPFISGKSCESVAVETKSLFDESFGEPRNTVPANGPANDRLTVPQTNPRVPANPANVSEALPYACVHGRTHDPLIDVLCTHLRVSGNSGASNLSDDAQSQPPEPRETLLL